MAFSPEDLRQRAISFFVASEMELYIGKSLEVAAFKCGESIAGGKRLTKNSSEARDVLDDLCIIEEKIQKEEGNNAAKRDIEEKPRPTSSYRKVKWGKNRDFLVTFGGFF